MAPRVTIPSLPEQTAVIDTDMMVVQNGATTKRISVATMKSANASVITDHLTDATGAHAASAVSAVPNASPLSGTDVQSQLGQAGTAVATLQTGLVTTDGNVAANSAALTAHAADTTAIHGIADTALLETTAGAQAKVDAHVNDTIDAHDASAISVVAGSGIVATDVQAALVELQAEIVTAGGSGITAEDAVDATAAAFAAGTHTNVTVTYNDTAGSISLASTAAGGGLTDGDKGDIVVSGSGATWMFDSTVVTAAAKTVLDDGSVGAMRGTLGVTLWSDNIVSAVAPPPRRVLNAQTGTTYTAVLADEHKMVTLSNAAAITVTLPQNVVTSFPIGAEIDFLWLGVGQPTFVAGSGATIVSSFGLAMPARYSVVTAKKIATDGWLLCPADADIQVVEAAAGTTYAVVAADNGKLKRLTGTATVTLPSGELVPGQRVDFVCIGGAATFALGSGATWDVAPTPSAVARAIGSFVTAIKMGATTWALTGDLA